MKMASPNPLPTAKCSSYPREDLYGLQTPSDTYSQSDGLDGHEEDSLPGVRIQSPNRSKKILNSEVGISKISDQETGFQRLQILYSLSSSGFLQEDTQTVNLMLRRTVYLGAFVSVITSISEANERAKANASTAQTVLLDRRYLSEIMKASLKSTVKLTVFATTAFHLSQAIAAYRNKSSVWEYGIATGLGLGLTGVGNGLRHIAKLTATGAIVGVVCGYVTCQVLGSLGMSQEQRNRIRIQEYFRSKSEPSTDSPPESYR
ncbi:unnamed protein product [Lymnaea stagnalis]|uniref:Complex I assembly factor TIMMDC1, mitochondrial n=1 Tax=Lymnaea stagnalis TaxID=6523 RepID=A0AAV2HCH9_LYMST